MRKIAVLLLFAVGCSSAPKSGGKDETGGSPEEGGSGGSTPSTGGKGGSATGGSGSGGSSTGGVTGGGGSPGTGGSTGGSGGGGMTGTGGASTGGMGGGEGGAAGGTTGGTGGIPPVTGTAYAYAAGAEFGNNTIVTFGFDLATGALTKKGAGTSGSGGPDYVAPHPSGKFLFVNNESASRATAYSIGADGALTMLNSTGSGGGGPAHIWVHKSGKWLFSANYTDGKLGAAKIADDGKITATSSASAGGNAHMALDDGQSGNFVFVPCASAGHVAQFKFDQATGALTANSPATVAAPSRPRHMAFNPSGKWAYVTHESKTAITTYAYDAATGLLSGAKDTTAPNDGAHVVVHPSGNFVFHIARGGSTTTVFKVGPDGALSEASKVGGGGYDGFITKDGKYLLTVSGNSVRVFSVNATTGALTAAGMGSAAGTSQSVAVAVF